MFNDDRRILNDEPAAEDSLDRGQIANALGRVISNCQPPLVIGLYGTWGHGKTSLMRQVESVLVAGENGDQECVPVWFDAWQHQFDEEPVLALLHTMVEVDELRDKLGRRATKRLRRHLRTIGDAFGGVVLRKAAAMTLGELRDMGDRSEDKRFLLRERQVRLREHFGKLIEEATDHGRRRLVFFIDDLDRCAPEQVLRVLEALKVFLNMDGCVYVLAVDQEALEGSIGLRYEGMEVSEAAYLDKIIQLPFQIPPISRQAMDQFVAELLPRSLSDLAPHLVEGLGGNPRQIKLFVNTFLLTSELAEERLGEGYKPDYLLSVLLIQYRLPYVFKRATQDPELLRRPGEWMAEKEQEPPAWAAPAAARLAPLPPEALANYIHLSNTRDVDLEPVIILIEGRNTLGDQIYTYIKLPVGRIDSVREHLTSGGNFVPSEYGTVVASGHGRPSVEVKEEVGEHHYHIFFEPKGE